MKKILTLLCLSCCLYTNVTAQTAKAQVPESKSKTVEFLDRNGQFLLKDFYDLDPIQGVKNQVLVITDILSNKKIGCLRITTSYYTSSLGTDDYIGTLDSDELDACVKCLQYIKDNVIGSTSDNYKEIGYTSRDNLQIGAYYSSKSSKWVVYVQTKGYTSRSMKVIDSEKIDNLITVFNTAKNLIIEKTK